MTLRAAPGLLLAAALILPYSARAQHYFVYVGSYTAELSSGVPPRAFPGRPAAQPSTSQCIYGWRFDNVITTLSPLGLVAEAANSAHVWVSPNGKYLYAVNWQENSARVPRGISAHAVDSRTGVLKLLNKQSSAGELPNQVVIDPSGKVAAAVNYKTGNMSHLPVHGGGTLGEPFAVEQSKPISPRGDGPQAHGVIFTRTAGALCASRAGAFRVHEIAGLTRHAEAAGRKDEGDEE